VALLIEWACVFFFLRMGLFYFLIIGVDPDPDPDPFVVCYFSNSPFSYFLVSFGPYLSL
jgi:hypothetical protein